MQWEHLVDMIRANIPDYEVRKYIDIDENTKLIEDLDYDSLAIMSLLSMLEEIGIEYTRIHNFFSRFNICGEIYEGICELKTTD